jgi:hypothetical protein
MAWQRLAPEQKIINDTPAIPIPSFKRRRFELGSLGDIFLPVAPELRPPLRSGRDQPNRKGTKPLRRIISL